LPWVSCGWGAVSKKAEGKHRGVYHTANRSDLIAGRAKKNNDIRSAQKKLELSGNKKGKGGKLLPLLENVHDDTRPAS